MKNICLMFCLLFMSACVTLPDHNMGRADLTVNTDSHTSADICYTTKFLLDGKLESADTVDDITIRDNNEKLADIVASLLNKQNMYKSTKVIRGGEGYSLEFVMEQKKFPANDYIMELLGGITFGFIPLTETYVWDLKVLVSDKSRLLKIYDFEDGMKRYMETLLLPIGLTPYYGKSAAQNTVWTNMVTHALNKIAADVTTH